MPIVTGGSSSGGASSPGFEIGYAQITAGVNIVSTTEATPTTIIAPGALTFDGQPVLVHFFAPFVELPLTTATSNFVVFTLFEGATQIGRFATFLFQDLASTQDLRVPVSVFYRFSPTAGAHTYIVGAHVNTATGTPNVGAGAAGTGTAMPAFVRFTKV